MAILLIMLRSVAGAGGDFYGVKRRFFLVVRTILFIFVGFNDITRKTR